MPPFLIINKHGKTKDEIEALEERHASRCVLFDENGNLIMVSLDSEEQSRGRYYGIPGGKVEEGEDFETACRREVLEEAGFVIDTVTSIGSIALVRKDYLSISHGFIAHVKLADQKPLSLTDEEKTENFETCVMSLQETISLLEEQYVKHHQAATLRNLTFILEAKRVLGGIS